MLWILLVFDGAEVGESGEAVSLLSRTPKARASRLFLECESARTESFATLFPSHNLSAD
jgi:hypothetical protein